MQCSAKCNALTIASNIKPKTAQQPLSSSDFPQRVVNNLASIFSGVVWQSMFEPVLLKHNKKDGIF